MGMISTGRKMMQAAYTGVGGMTPRGKALGNAAATQAFNSAISAGQRTSTATKASYVARKSAHMRAGKTPTRLAMGAGLIGTSTAMRPNSNESRTSYRGPMQTGRGSGRYA